MFLRLLFCILLLLTHVQTRADNDSPIVAVAANFSPVLEEIITRFTASTGFKVRMTSGSSGTLVRQIEQGAPFELFFSADENYVIKLHEMKLTQDTGRIYAVGKLVLFIPELSRLDKMQDIDGILRQLASNKQYRIAMANPELAPYGLAASQVLSRFIDMNMLRERIIQGENVGQTAQFALTGSVDAAFLPYSLAITKKMQEQGNFELIPRDWYSPINQRMVLLNNAGNTARSLYSYINSDTAHRIIDKYGYTTQTN